MLSVEFLKEPGLESWLSPETPSICGSLQFPTPMGPRGPVPFPGCSRWSACGAQVLWSPGCGTVRLQGLAWPQGHSHPASVPGWWGGTPARAPLRLTWLVSRRLGTLSGWQLHAGLQAMKPYSDVSLDISVLGCLGRVVSGHRAVPCS